MTPLQRDEILTLHAISNAFQAVSAPKFMILRLQRPPKSSTVSEIIIILKDFQVLRSNAVFGLSWRPLGPSLGPILGVLLTPLEKLFGPFFVFRSDACEMRPFPFSRYLLKVRFKTSKHPPKGPLRSPHEATRSPEKPPQFLHYFAAHVNATTTLHCNGRYG